MYKKLLNALMFSLLALALSFGVSYVSAWTAPTQAPPLGNTNPPINTSATTQSKSGNFTAPNLIDTSATTQAKAGNFTAPNIINTSATAQSKAGGLSVGGLTLPAGGIIDSGGSVGVYGAATIRGTKNGWGGVNFRDSSNNNQGTLMMHSGYSGFHNAAETNWRWYATEGGNTYQPGYVQASDVYAGGRWMSSIVSDTGPDSGTLCGWYSDASAAYGYPNSTCKGYSPVSGCPPGYTRQSALTHGWWNYYCTKD